MSDLPFDVSDIGVVGLCVLFVLALARGWICTGRELHDVERQRDQWQTVALRSLTVTERTTDASEVAAHALAAIPEVLEGRTEP